MTLHGLRVLNTRPAGQNHALSQAITDAGGIAIEVPTLAIEPTAHDWQTQLPRLTEVQHAIFISSNAVRFFYACIKEPWPTTLQTIAIGEATANALRQQQVVVHHIPPVADSKHLLELPSLQHVNHQTIVLIKGEKGSSDIETRLKARGARLIPLAVYRRRLPKTDPQRMHSLWHDDKVDIILFTSEEAMRNLLTMVGKKAHAWLCNTPCLVISERLATAAYQLGMQTIIISRYDTILKTLEHFNQGLIHDHQQ